MIGKLIFWASAVIILYVGAGYPLLVWLLRLCCSRRVRKAAITPQVSLLVAARNEASVIGAKVRNALALDYPHDRLEIVVVSDGSTDDTPEIVRTLAAAAGQDRVRLLNFREHRGKLAVLNDAMPQLGGEIVVFSDATSMLAEDSLRLLVENFADDQVGAVSGIYRVAKEGSAALPSPDELYWRYETLLKKNEAAIGGLTGAHGSLYAIRRSLYPFPSPRTINDDFVIPTSVLQKGFSIAYEPAAVSSEEVRVMTGFGRRVRLTAGNIEQLREARTLLSPLRPVPLLCFLSHKGGRLLLPPALLALLISNTLMASLPGYRWVLWAQIVFYGLALAAALVRKSWGLLGLPLYLCAVNAAWFVWLYRALFGGRSPSLSGDSDRPVEWS